MNRSCRLGMTGVILSGLALGCTNASVSTSFNRAEEGPAVSGSARVGGKEDSAKPPQGAVVLNTVGFGGVETALQAARGKVVLVDCWATWCPPCVASFPKLVEKYDKYASKGLAVISVSLDKPENNEKVIAFLQKQNATFTNLLLKVDDTTHLGLQHKFDYEGGIPHAALFSKTGQRLWAGHPLDPDLQVYLETELNK